MRNIIFLSMLVLIIASPIFADENAMEIKNRYFYFLFNKVEKEDAKFINLNPLFFGVNNFNYLPLNLFDNNYPGNNSGNHAAKETGNNNDWLGFLLAVTALSIAQIDYHNNPQPYINSKELWDRKTEEENLYQRIMRR